MRGIPTWLFGEDLTQKAVCAMLDMPQPGLDALIVWLALTSNGGRKGNAPAALVEHMLPTEARPAHSVQ